MSLRENSPAVRWLARAAVFPCLAAWLTVRLRVCLPGMPALLAAVVLTLSVLFLFARFDLASRFLLPWGLSRKTALAGAAAFLLGGIFDISYAMLSISGSRLLHPLFRLLCHAGSGLLFACILLALLKAAMDLKGLGRTAPRQMLLLFLGLNALTALYVLTSRTVYVWDTAGYWSVARSLAQAPLGYSQLRGVLETTLTLDYNHLLALPISLVMRLLGGSRAVFLFSIANFYILPTLWALAALAQGRKWGGLALAGLFPMLAYTGLVGFVDVAACGLAVWAYVVYTSDRPPVSRGLISGALLVGAFLLRRYFFFFAASFGVAALVQKLLFDRKKWADFAALFTSCAVCSLTFTYKFLLDKVLGSDYGDLYSAYQLGLKSDALLICRYFGWAVLLLLAGYTAYALFRGKDRPQLVLALVQLAVCFLVFVSVQSHGQQHLLLYLPALAVLAVSLFSALPEGRSLLPAGLVLLYCLIPKAQPASIDEISSPAVLPSFVFYGPQREDTDQLLALADYVDGLSAEAPRTAVVLSSSLTFNSETLTNLRPSLNLPESQVRTVIQSHGTVDKRDPFNWNTPTADYLILGDPIQIHLGEDNQQIMALLVHDVLDGAGPGAAYEPLPQTFTLEKGVTVRIYRRTRAWTYEDYRSISGRLTALYPDYAELYSLPGWLTP